MVQSALGRKSLLVITVLAALAVSVRPLAAQPTPSRLDLGGLVEVGGELERYLRVLEIAGLVPLTPWSIQPFTPTQVGTFRANRAHPWRDRFDASNDAVHLADGRWLLRPKTRAIDNTTFPVQVGGGPTWSGRGVTGEVQAGFLASWRWAYLEAAPLAFSAENSSFVLAPNEQTGAMQFADARYPENIDAPQRFGSSSYSRLRPGTSSLTVDSRILVLGATSAPQQWGPAREYPLVLGPNAGGFPAMFLGTSQPVDLWLFTVHGRLLYGQLDQSAFSAPVAGERTRLGTGIVGLITPRGVPGLEIGGSRFIHEPWPAGGIGLSVLNRPIAGGVGLIGNATNSPTVNQVASLFARWALPRAKAEFYGEMYREDFPGHFHEALSLVEKPDDLAAFTIGFQRVLTASDRTIRVLRGELVSGQTSHQERTERGFAIPMPPYIHAGVTQGHTEDGLILGSPDAYGGAGWRFGLDQYTTSGRTSFALERSYRFDWLRTLPQNGPMVHPDVIYSLRADLLRFHGASQIGLTLIPAIDLNRNLVAGHDVFNLTTALTLQGLP
jgi:hypothetical protein